MIARRRVARTSVFLALCVTLACNAPAPPAPPASARPVSPLDDAAFVVEWGLPAVPAVVSAGQPFAAAILVTNRGAAIWAAPDPAAPSPAAGAVRLGYRWWRGDEVVADYAPARGDLSEPLGPGQSAVLALEVRAPAAAGEYLLQLDLVQELVAWFESKGATRVTVPVRVTAAP